MCVCVLQHSLTTTFHFNYSYSRHEIQPWNICKSAQKYAGGTIPLMTNLNSRKHMHAFLSLYPSSHAPLIHVCFKSDIYWEISRWRPEPLHQQISASHCTQDFLFCDFLSTFHKYCILSDHLICNGAVKVIIHQGHLDVNSWKSKHDQKPPCTHTHTHAGNKTYSSSCKCVLTTGCSWDSCCFPLNGAL